MKRSAARELTCSQSLNSSAVASSLSVWGRWISLALLCTSLTDSPLLPAPPAFLQPLGAVAAVGCVVLRVDGGGYGERDCCGRLCGAAGGWRRVWGEGWLCMVLRDCWGEVVVFEYGGCWVVRGGMC